MRAAIVLAAGASRRFGRPDKLRQSLGGVALLDHAVARASRSGAFRIVVVGARPRRTSERMIVRRAPRGTPLATSLAIGLAALRPIEREALIFLADMPFAYAPRLRLMPGVNAVRPHVRGRPGHPVLVRVSVARALVPAGDRGLGGMAGQRSVRGTAAHLIDVDTPADLRRARHAIRRWGRC